MKKMHAAIMVLAVVMIFNVTPAPADPINLALTGTATQVSTYGTGVAANAIDNMFNSFDNFSMSHTDAAAYAWWQVDLGNTYNISDIDIYNRIGDYGWRIYGAVVSVIGADNTTVWSSSPIPGSRNDSTMLDVYHFDVAESVTGRIVKVQLTRTIDDPYLHMREVQVWGSSTPPGPGPVPIPAAAWLLGTGLVGLVAVRRRLGGK